MKKRFLLKAFCLCITGLCQAKAAALQPPIPDSLFIPYQDSLHVLAVPFHSSNLKLTCAKSDMEAMFDKSPNDSDLQSLYLAATHGNVKFTFETADTFTVNYTMDLNDSTSLSLQIIPNPFKTSTRVQVWGMRGQKAEIAIYNVNGSLVNKWSANRGTFVWDGKDFYGQDAASGTYVVSVKTGGRVLNKHAVIMR